MGHGTELRVPFLDLSLVELAMRLQVSGLAQILMAQIRSASMNPAT
jgi:asparagine synthetase B (glutamine-hydrolysing)